MSMATPNRPYKYEPDPPKNLTVNAGGSYGWYDFSVQIDGIKNFERRFSGRVETGKPSKSDPYMGRV